MVQGYKFSQLFNQKNKKEYVNANLNSSNQPANPIIENKIKNDPNDQINLPNVKCAPLIKPSAKTPLLILDEDNIPDRITEKPKEKQGIVKNEVVNLEEKKIKNKPHSDLLENCSLADIELNNSNLLIPIKNELPLKKELNKENMNMQNASIKTVSNTNLTSSNTFNNDKIKKENKIANLKNIPLDELIKMKGQTENSKKSMLKDNCKSVPHIPIMNVPIIGTGFMYNYITPFPMPFFTMAKL